MSGEASATMAAGVIAAGFALHRHKTSLDDKRQIPNRRLNLRFWGS
jgi:hypothetical protein